MPEQLKQVTMTVRFVVDENNTHGVHRFYDRVAHFIDQLKQDFNNDIRHSEGDIDITDYEGPELIDKRLAPAGGDNGQA